MQLYAFNIIMRGSKSAFSVLSTKGKETIDIAIKADLVVLNTVVSGKWLDVVLNKDVPHVLPKVIRMPKTHVVHLVNNKELMDVAENSVAKRVPREHVRESLGVRNEDILFAAINSVSWGKGEDLFLRSFYESLQLIKEKKLQVPSIHAVIVGSDMSVKTKLETELRDFVRQKKIQHGVHFVNKTLTVAISSSN
ncbi:putative Glycosyl-transferase family 4_5 [Helianthus anomalus]